MSLQKISNVFDNDDIKEIDKKYIEDKVNYFSKKLDKNPENNEDTFYYLTKDVLTLKKEEYTKLILDLEVINNDIFKKIVFHIMENDESILEKMKFSKKVISVLKHQYKKIKLSYNKEIFSYKSIPLTYFGRFDILVDKNDEFKIVEINSETPAGMPESFTIPQHITPIVLKKYKDLIDVNNDIDYNLYKSLQTKINGIQYDGNKNISVVYGDGVETEMYDNFSQYLNDENSEDYINTLHLTEFLTRQLGTENTVNMVKVENLEIKSDGLYYKGTKQDYIWSFYPLEWFFTDKGGNKFWDLFLNDTFELLNNPLNLITQNKAIWAYIWDIVEQENSILTLDEKNIIKKYVPKYFWNKPTEVKTILKPLLYREGVGIGDDDFIGDFVYQSYIEQKSFEINCFYDGVVHGYMTLGIYVGEKGYIGTYNRFCDHVVTDELSQTIPLYLVE